MDIWIGNDSSLGGETSGNHLIGTLRPNRWALFSRPVGGGGASGALMPTLCCLSEAANSPTKTIGSVSRQYFTFTDVDFYNLIIWKLV